MPWDNAEFDKWPTDKTTEKFISTFHLNLKKYIFNHTFKFPKLFACSLIMAYFKSQTFKFHSWEFCSQ